MTCRQFVLAATLLISASAAPAAEDIQTTTATARPLPAYHGLDPATIQAIQGIGRGVLAAKHSSEADGDEDGLRDELRTLSSALDEVLALSQPSVALLAQGDRTLQSQNGKESADHRPGGAADGSSAFDRDGAKVGMLRSKLSSLHERLARLTPSSQRNGGDALSQRKANLATKAAEIRDALTEALEDSTGRRKERLAAIRERLRVKTLPEHLADLRRTSGAPEPEPAPTISTIVRHR